MDQKGIERINELAHKQKAGTLTAAEKEEQAALRREFINDVKRSLKAQLDNIDIVEKDGTVTHLKDKNRS